MKIYQLFEQKLQLCLQITDVTEQLKNSECTEDYECIIQSLVKEAMHDMYNWATTTKLPNYMNSYISDLISKTANKQLELDAEIFEMYFTPSTINMPCSYKTNLRLEAPLKSAAYDVMREVTGYDIILTIHPYHPTAVKTLRLLAHIAVQATRQDILHQQH